MGTKKIEVPEKGYITYNAEQKLFDTATFLDYDRIHSVMDFLNWTWYDTGKDTPEVYEIREKAHEMLREAYDRFWEAYAKEGSLEEYFISSGGLKASYRYHTDNHIDDKERDCFNLSFVIEDTFN